MNDPITPCYANWLVTGFVTIRACGCVKGYVLCNDSVLRKTKEILGNRPTSIILFLHPVNVIMYGIKREMLLTECPAMKPKDESEAS